MQRLIIIMIITIRIPVLIKDKTTLRNYKGNTNNSNDDIKENDGSRPIVTTSPVLT